MKTSQMSRKVYAIVRRIPSGCVATYGQIASLAGHPGAARAVGTALAKLPSHLESVVPWHRVVSTKGISARRSPQGSWRQRDLLVGEGIEVRRSGSIDLNRFGWDGPRPRRYSR